VQQEILIAKTMVSGRPLVMPFEALFCHPPQGAERDIVLNTQNLIDSIRTLKARNKGRADARKARGILPPEANILRAMVECTEFIKSSSIKYYVACRQIH
jgi:hypothetical protein